MSTRDPLVPDEYIPKLIQNIISNKSIKKNNNLAEILFMKHFILSLINISDQASSAKLPSKQILAKS